MNLNSLLILFVLSTCSLTASSQIIEGDPVNENEFNYLVYIQVRVLNPVNRRARFYGGGFIVNERWVLTCAHNFHLKIGEDPPNEFAPDEVTVIAGTKNLRQGPAQVRRVDMKNVIEHGEYRKGGNDTFDVALVFLKNDPLEYNERVQPANLATKHEEIPVGSRCIIAGWGITGLWHPREPNHALKAEMDILDGEICRNFIGDEDLWFDKFDEHYHLCYGCREGENNCRFPSDGDSGSPVVMRKEDGRDVVIGIHTGESADRDSVCTFRHPGMGMDIRRIRTWMDAAMRKGEFYLWFERVARYIATAGGLIGTF